MFEDRDVITVRRNELSKGRRGRSARKARPARFRVGQRLADGREGECPIGRAVFGLRHRPEILPRSFRIGLSCAIGVENLCEQLRAVDDTRSRANEERVGVHGPDLRAGRQATALDNLAPELRGGVQVITARRHHDDVGGRAADGIP